MLTKRESERDLYRYRDTYIISPHYIYTHIYMQTKIQHEHTDTYRQDIAPKQTHRNTNFKTHTEEPTYSLTNS